MSPKQKLELRSIAVKKRLREIAALELDDLTEEIRSESVSLQTELTAVEVRMTALISAGEDEGGGEVQRNAGDGEGAEVRRLIADTKVGNILTAVLEHRQTVGREAEIQAHFKVGGNQIPLAMLRTPEHRAVTAAPANVGTQEQPIVPGVFPDSLAAFMGIEMPTVPVGDTTFPVLTTNAAVEALAEAGAGTETDGSFSAELLAPGRLQAHFRYSIEDRARFSGMDGALRQNLSEALAAALDKEIIAGANGLLTGVNLANNNVNAVTTYSLYRSGLIYGRIDGTYASQGSDIRLVVGGPTYAHAASQYRSNNADFNALDALMRDSGGVRVSAHVPVVNASKQNAIVRRGLRRDMVAPVWEGVTLLHDPYSKKSEGEIVLTAVMLYAVKILRSEGFYKQQTQHA